MKKKGQYAKVSVMVGAVAQPVLELREWTISASSEKIGANVAGDDWSSHLIGLFSWEGEATCISGDQYWLDMLKEHCVITFFDNAEDVDPSYSGSASVDFERGTPHDDIIESTLTFTGNGELTSPASAPVGP